MPAPIYVSSIDPQFQVRYNDGGSSTVQVFQATKWKRFDRLDPSSGRTFSIWYRPTSTTLEAQVEYSMPAGSPAGRYRIEVFVPGRHATSRRVVFFVAHNFRTVGGQPQYDDKLVLVDQNAVSDRWVSLGEYELNPTAHSWAGRIRQMDLSVEDPAQEVSFSPVRWVPLFAPPVGAVRFDSPVGTQEERDAPFSANYPDWTALWFDYNPFLSWYYLGYHTGSDLNKKGGADADKNSAIYAIADGTVTFAGAGSGWGKLIVIEHPDAQVTLHNGTTRRQKVYSRYGHVTDDMRVKKGDIVKRGQLIGFIGLPAGQTSGWHLHFDIAYSEKLGKTPTHWPDMTLIKKLKAEGKTNTAEYRRAQEAVMAEVLAHYIDPYKFLKANHNQ